MFILSVQIRPVVYQELENVGLEFKQSLEKIQKNIDFLSDNCVTHVSPASSCVNRLPFIVVYNICGYVLIE